jgi:competence protein ComEA
MKLIFSENNTGKTYATYFIFCFVGCCLFSTISYANPVNINRADAETIAHSLKGVNIKKSEGIVAYRMAYGDFKSLDDVRRVSGMGPKTIEVNKNDILFTDEPLHAASETVRPMNQPSVAPSHVPPAQTASFATWILWVAIALVLLGVGLALFNYFKKRHNTAQIDKIFIKEIFNLVRNFLQR